MGNQTPNLCVFVQRKTCSMSTNSICFAFASHGAGHQMPKSVFTNIQATLENALAVHWSALISSSLKWELMHLGRAVNVHEHLVHGRLAHGRSTAQLAANHLLE